MNNTREAYAKRGAPVPAHLWSRDALAGPPGLPPPARYLRRVPTSRLGFPLGFSLHTGFILHVGLSAREVEVARLVAAGMTNREIAAELTIAPKTAAAHVEHMEFGAVRSGDVNGLERREACLDEKFHFALVAESGDHATVSCGIESREQQTAAFDEFAFELEFLFKERGPKRSAA